MFISKQRRTLQIKTTAPKSNSSKVRLKQSQQTDHDLSEQLNTTLAKTQGTCPWHFKNQQSWRDRERSRSAQESKVFRRPPWTNHESANLRKLWRGSCMLSKNGKALRNPKMKTGSRSRSPNSKYNSSKPKDTRSRSYKQMPEPRLYKLKPRSKTTMFWKDTIHSELQIRGVSNSIKT